MDKWTITLWPNTWSPALFVPLQCDRCAHAVFSPPLSARSRYLFICNTIILIFAIHTLLFSFIIHEEIMLFSYLDCCYMHSHFPNFPPDFSLLSQRTQSELYCHGLFAPHSKQSCTPRSILSGVTVVDMASPTAFRAVSATLQMVFAAIKHFSSSAKHWRQTIVSPGFRTDPFVTVCQTATKSCLHSSRRRI